MGIRRTDLSSLAGKVVLVVGGSSGMGRTFAVRVAQAGAHVAVTARRQELLETLETEIADSGGTCLVLAADALDPDAARAVVATTVERFGRIDVALLNAGGAPALDLRRLHAADVTAYMRSNYDVVVNYLFPVLDQMRVQGDGTVMHTNSLAGFVGVPLQGPYSAAKAALRLLIDTCRIEFAADGISFVTVYPGFVATAKSANDGMPAPGEISEERAVEHMLRALVRKRWDRLFPLPAALQIRVGLLVPKRVLNAVLRRTIRAEV